MSSLNLLEDIESELVICTRQVNGMSGELEDVCVKGMIVIAGLSSFLLFVINCFESDLKIIVSHRYATVSKSKVQRCYSVFLFIRLRKPTYGDTLLAWMASASCLIS